MATMRLEPLGPQPPGCLIADTIATDSTNL